MTRRSLLWITALAVGLGAVAGTPPSAGAEAEAAGLWSVSIDTPPVSERRVLEISGHARITVLPAASVTVTVTPKDPLPPECGGPRDDTTTPAVDGAYHVQISVECNGPYQVHVVARMDRGDPGQMTKDIGVAERPPAPDPPVLMTGVSPQMISWPVASDIDAAGWSLILDGEARLIEDLRTTQAPVPQDGFSHTFALRQLRWGAGGPGSDPVESDPSGEMVPGVPDRSEPPPPDTEPTTPALPPGSDPPAANPAPAAGQPGSSRTSPPTTAGRIPVTSGPVDTSTTTRPEGYAEELPYGVPEEAFEPGARPSRSSGAGSDERAAGATSPTGLVRTSDEEAPGLVAPLALGLMLVTIAAHIGWYLRRSRPPGSGQASLR